MPFSANFHDTNCSSLIFVKNCYTKKFNENPLSGLVTESRSWMDEHCIHMRCP